MTLTIEELIEQEQNKKEREQEVEKTQPKKGPEPLEGKEGKYVIFLYTACIQHADKKTNVCALLQLTQTSTSYQMQITSVVEH